jgi:3-hydroxyacyl-CoA dehydrogenase
VEKGIADRDVAVMVILCEGRTFMAGADIREFGKPPQQPFLPEVVQFIEDSSKPLIAAIHGTALGGGLEIALGCHFRIAAPTAKVGLPEVKLGILPGAGGTQRLPRLVGPQAALDMIVSGNPIAAQKAQTIGIIDEIADGDLKAAALTFAKKVISEKRPIKKISSLAAKVDNPAIF